MSRAEQRWYHTADRQRLVPESDQAGAYLAYAVGDEMPDPAPEPEPPAEPDEVEAPKSRRPAANKSRRPAADK